jgi:hypothetical protein
MTFRRDEELFRQRIQYRGLEKQATPFAMIVPHHVCRAV